MTNIQKTNLTEFFNVILYLCETYLDELSDGLSESIPPTIRSKKINDIEKVRALIKGRIGPIIARVSERSVESEIRPFIIREILSDFMLSGTGKWYINPDRSPVLSGFSPILAQTVAVALPPNSTEFIIVKTQVKIDKGSIWNDSKPMLISYYRFFDHHCEIETDFVRDGVIFETLEGYTYFIDDSIVENTSESDGTERSENV